MDTLEYLIDKYNIDFKKKNPRGEKYTEIPNVGRNELAKICRELGFKKGVEVGVERGRFSEVLIKENPQMELYGVDLYKKYDGYGDFKLDSTFRNLYKEGHGRLDKYPNYHFIRKYSMDAVKDFEDNSLDFVYIDANHKFASVVEDIHYWQKKIRPGGIICGHDFFKQSSAEKVHVYRAVIAYTACYEIKPWFVLGAEANDEGLIRDKLRSWMWVV